MKKLRSRKVFKITTDYIENNCYNFNLTMDDAKENEQLISIANNQVFLAIEKIIGHKCDFKHIDELKKKMNNERYKRTSQNTVTNIKMIRKQIDMMLFMPYIINVTVDKPSVYRKICKNGFVVNGNKYVRLLCGAGMGRRATVSFCSENIYDQLDQVLRNGIIVDEINIAKWNAYYGLYMSGMFNISTPRVCVVSDCELEVVGNKVDFIIDDKKEDLLGNEIDFRRIEERDYVFNANVFDGAGMISLRQAKIWADDLGLDYMPSNFIIRSAFIKGAVGVFDFHKFSREVAGKDYIIDYYGKRHNVDEIDIILTTSQFKMYKQYKNWDEYLYYFNLYQHSWGVSRVAPREDKEYSTINYQYIQTLNLNKESLEELAKPTIDWIQNICSGDMMYTLLFLFGHADEDENINDILKRIDNNFVKALLLDNELFDDDYIKRKTYQMISKKIDEAKIGRLWSRGNYQTMIPDLYAMAEWIFGLQVRGLLKKDEYYSTFWSDRNVKTIDCCRSPMVDPSEHKIVSVVHGNKMQEWFGYLDSGIIMNIWGLDTITYSDSDFDGDLIYTTDNETMINNTYKNRLPITYDKESAPVEKFCMNNIVKTDLNTFDCKIGPTTNYSTKFIAQLCNYDASSREYQELVTRIKLLRRYIGDSIDAGKGIKTKPFPQEWKKKVKVLDEWPDNIKKEQWFYNNLVEKRKPYFFIYIYPELMKEYKEYMKNNNKICMRLFGLRLSELKSKDDKNDIEKKFIKSFYHDMPVVKSNCIMNQLAWKIEGVENGFKYPRNTENENHNLAKKLTSGYYKINKNKYDELKLIYKNWQRMLVGKNIFNGIMNDSTNDYLNNDTKEDFSYDNANEIIVDALSAIITNKQELADYLVKMCYLDEGNYNKAFCWLFAGEGIIDTILDKHKNGFVNIPCKDKDGDVAYLGKKYSMMHVLVK